MAEQIINVDVNKKLLLRKDALGEILLRDEIKHLPLVVLSIAGTYRQGKSFILNFFLRFLKATCKEKKNPDEWLSDSTEPLSGFKWKHSFQRETVGILMWPEVFLSRLPSGQEVGIVLLDTQGTFDNQTSVSESAAIFAFSTLLSSVQIFNVMSNINFNELMSLKNFLKYGELLKDEDADKTPFQNFMFLIRDWHFLQDHSYGKDGGQKYLDSVLNVDESSGQNVPEDVAFLKKSLRTYFNKVDCFLLPDPGEEVKTKGTDKLEEVDTDFKKYVDVLISEIFKPENLVVKRIDDKEVTGGELYLLIEQYFQQFQNGQIPDFHSIYQATAEVQHISLFEEYVKKFQSLMHENEIKDPDFESISSASLAHKYNSNRISILNEFKTVKKMGGENMRQKYHLKLSEEMDCLYFEYHRMNSQKIQVETERKAADQEKLEQRAVEERQKKLQEDLLKLFESALAEEERNIKKEERDKETRKMATSNSN